MAWAEHVLCASRNLLRTRGPAEPPPVPLYQRLAPLCGGGGDCVLHLPLLLHGSAGEGMCAQAGVALGVCLVTPLLGVGLKKVGARL